MAVDTYYSWRMHGIGNLVGSSYLMQSLSKYDSEGMTIAANMYVQ